jgi:tryptophan synthase alpha chain
VPRSTQADEVVDAHLEEQGAVSTPAVAGAQEIAGAFGKPDKLAALMPYVMGGFPNLSASRQIGEAYIEAGADVIEIGVPYSDPLADGPVIHAAGTRALAQGTTLDDVLDLARNLAQGVPVVLMSYSNLVLARGLERYAHDLREASVSGVIVPDVPLEEAPAFVEAFDAAGLAFVPLVAPTTPPNRMRSIGSLARGFLYAVAVTGITGERKHIAEGVGDLLARGRESTEVPVALGFGISNAQHARQAAELGADGVIVASRLVRAAGEAPDPAAAVRGIVAEMAAALQR